MNQSDLRTRIERCEREIAEARLVANVIQEDPQANMLILLWEMDWLREKAELEDLLTQEEVPQ